MFLESRLLALQPRWRRSCRVPARRDDFFALRMGIRAARRLKLLGAQWRIVCGIFLVRTPIDPLEELLELARQILSAFFGHALLVEPDRHRVDLVACRRIAHCEHQRVAWTLALDPAFDHRVNISGMARLLPLLRAMSRRSRTGVFPSPRRNDIGIFTEHRDHR